MPPRLREGEEIFVISNFGFQISDCRPPARGLPGAGGEFTIRNSQSTGGESDVAGYEELIDAWISRLLRAFGEAGRG